MIKLKTGDKKKIAKWLKLKSSYFANICSGRRHPGLALAVELEKISGISCKTWRYAESEELTNLIIQKWRKK